VIDVAILHRRYRLASTLVVEPVPISREYPRDIGGEDRGKTAKMAQFSAPGTTTFVRVRNRATVSCASSIRPMCA
jgi:hypothetical protein